MILSKSYACNGCPISCKTKFVISTTLFKGVKPIDFNLFCNQEGDSLTEIYSIQTPVNLGHKLESCTFILTF